MMITINVIIVTTLFNPAPGVTELPEEVYNNTDILCLNETEVGTLKDHVTII